MLLPINKMLLGVAVLIAYAVAVKHYPAQTIKMPVDHFHNESRYEPHSDDYFENRFWFDDTFYQPNGPVIIHNAGEQEGNASLPFLQIGLLQELAKATQGIAVVLEHRYYGQSLPVPVEDTEARRFLTVEQAMADQAYFAKNVVFTGKEHLNLTAPNTAWFAIGCSYAGALAAFERIQYPDLFWGAISSSGTTAVNIDNWQYWDANRRYGLQDCSNIMGKLINIFDNIMLHGNAKQNDQLKTFFGLPANTSNTDFAALRLGDNLQFYNWLPDLTEGPSLSLCPVLTAPTVHSPEVMKSERMAKEIIQNGGWANETDSLTIALLNYLGSPPQNPTAQFSPKDATGWEYQVCAEFGSFPTGNEPPHPLPIVSSLITVESFSKNCSENFNLTGLPEIERINKYGGHNLSYPHLMLVGGETDPWRPRTPLATLDTPTRLNYSSTPEQPWYLIPGGTHCWDYFGLSPTLGMFLGQPESVQKVLEKEKSAFKRWLKEWHDAHPDYNVTAES